jgi:hypothetical protein
MTKHNNSKIIFHKLTISKRKKINLLNCASSIPNNMVNYILNSNLVNKSAEQRKMKDKHVIYI